MMSLIYFSNCVLRPIENGPIAASLVAEGQALWLDDKLTMAKQARFANSEPPANGLRQGYGASTVLRSGLPSLR